MKYKTDDDIKLKEKILEKFLGGVVYGKILDDYLVCTDKEADQVAKECILDSLRAFNASFILSHSKVDMDEKYLSNMQRELCEGANDLVKSMINDIDHFVEDAIKSDGRGHFLNTYDGEEHEIKIGKKYYYIYRLN
jgi:hypothetical protein